MRIKNIYIIIYTSVCASVYLRYYSIIFIQIIRVGVIKHYYRQILRYLEKIISLFISISIYSYYFFITITYYTFVQNILYYIRLSERV